MSLKVFGVQAAAASEGGDCAVATPVGQPCAWCEELFVSSDDGVVIPILGAGTVSEIAFHYACHLRQIVGGLNHQRGHCLCCGGVEPSDPVWLTKRQAAVQAVSVWMQSH